MTRLEADIIEALEKSKKYSGAVNIVQKIRTTDNYIYTVVDLRYTPGNMTECEFFKTLVRAAAEIIEVAQRKLEDEKFLWLQHEGRLISTNSIKDMWLEFDGYDRAELEFDDKQGPSVWVEVN